jgi:hypothetical protein
LLRGQNHPTPEAQLRFTGKVSSLGIRINTSASFLEDFTARYNTPRGRQPLFFYDRFDGSSNGVFFAATGAINRLKSSNGSKAPLLADAGDMSEHKQTKGAKNTVRKLIRHRPPFRSASGLFCCHEIHAESKPPHYPRGH